MTKLSAAEAREVTGASDTSLYDALERLAGAGVIRELTNRKRDQVWGAAPILDELEDLSMRIELAAR